MPAFLLKRESGSGSSNLEYPTGTVQAVVVGLYDLGTHANKYNKTKPEEDRKRRLCIRYELCGHHYIDRDGNQRPLTIMNTENFKLWSNPDGTKCTNLWSQIASIVGLENLPKEDEEFDFQTLLGKNVWVTIIETSKGGYKITNHTQVPAAMEKYGSVTPQETFMIVPDENGQITIPDNIPQWSREDIENSDEYQEWINTSVKTSAKVPLPTPGISVEPPVAPAPVAPAPVAPPVAPAPVAPPPVAPPPVAPAPVAPPVAPAPVAPPVAPAPVAPPVAPAPSMAPVLDLSRVPEALRSTVQAATARLTE